MEKKEKNMEKLFDKINDMAERQYVVKEATSNLVAGLFLGAGYYLGNMDSFSKVEFLNDVLQTGILTYAATYICSPIYRGMYKQSEKYEELQDLKKEFNSDFN